MTVLLIEHREGQCRAIVGEKDGDRGRPLMCGLPIVMRRDGTPSSWCADHHAKYVVPPRAPRPERSFAFTWRPASTALSTAAA
jgi:hypothetical protein